MADFYERIQAELENVERVLTELDAAGSLEDLSTLELAGVATLLHNFYNGIENILKQMILQRNISMPTGPAWHRELLDTAVSANLISSSTVQELRKYLAFRHFFSHGYAFDLKHDIMKPLVQNVHILFEYLKKDIND